MGWSVWSGWFVWSIETAGRAGMARRAGKSVWFDSLLERNEPHEPEKLDQPEEPDRPDKPDRPESGLPCQSAQPMVLDRPPPAIGSAPSLTLAHHRTWPQAASRSAVMACGEKRLTTIFLSSGSNKSIVMSDPQSPIFTTRHDVLASHPLQRCCAGIVLVACNRSVLDSANSLVDYE